MSSPYNPPKVQTGMPMQQPRMGGGNPLQPLYQANGWLTFIGWFNLVLGVIYCITIVGIIGGALMIWIGICLKTAGESLKAGYPSNNPALLYRASNNLATVAKIVGILVCIYLAAFVIMILFFIGMMIISLAAAAGAAS
jgi:hypothetical protein